VYIFLIIGAVLKYEFYFVKKSYDFKVLELVPSWISIKIYIKNIFYGLKNVVSLFPIFQKD